jgi:hypothetical protein
MFKIIISSVVMLTFINILLVVSDVICTSGDNCICNQSTFAEQIISINVSLNQQIMDLNNKINQIKTNNTILTNEIYELNDNIFNIIDGKKYYSLYNDSSNPGNYQWGYDNNGDPCFPLCEVNTLELRYTCNDNIQIAEIEGQTVINLQSETSPMSFFNFYYSDGLQMETINKNVVTNCVIPPIILKSKVNFEGYPVTFYYNQQSVPLTIGIVSGNSFIYQNIGSQLWINKQLSNSVVTTNLVNVLGSSIVTGSQVTCTCAEYFNRIVKES